MGCGLRDGELGLEDGRERGEENNMHDILDETRG